jgi:nitrous oxidase accessory protein NosD
MKRILPAFALLLFALAFPAMVRAQDCTAIGGVGTNIDTPGNYCMVGDLVGSATSGSFIGINADNVLVDCRGFQLRNTTTPTYSNAYAISINGHRNVQVRNCRVTGGFAAGIYAYQDNGQANLNKNLKLTDNDIAGTFWYGILAYGTDIEIRGNRITGIGGRASFAMGIRVGGSNVAGEGRYHVVRDNIVSGVRSDVNNAYGIYGNNPVGSVFEQNTITGPFALSQAYKSYGVYLFAGDTNKIRANHIVLLRVQSNTLGVYTSTSEDECYDNHIRGGTWLLNCQDAYGNY